MAAAKSTTRRWGPTLRVAALAMAGTTVVAAAALSPGYEVQETEQLETSVWVARDDGQYARVNTDLGEFEAVQNVSEPSAVVQSGARGMVFTQAYGQAWAITGADPVDLIDSDADSGDATAATIPSGTESISTAGDTIVYLTASGEVYLGTLPDEDGDSTNPHQLDPYRDVEVDEGQEAPTFVANAVAVGADGTVAMYSAAEGAIRVYSIAEGAFEDEPQEIEFGPSADQTPQMVIVSGRWVLASADGSRVWIEGVDAAVSTTVDGDGTLQQGGSSLDEVLIADQSGLVSVSLDGGAVTRVAEASGTPAAPVIVEGVAYAAWVSSAAGTLWSSDGEGTTSLEVDADELDDAVAVSPVFSTNGDRAVLTETSSGMVWLVPDGTLLPITEWDDLAETEQQEGTVEVEDVVEQEPPVAEDDTLGVRAGSVVSLPLLLNDHDPNSKDVLTIDPASVTSVGSEFGEVGLVADDQSAVVTVAATEGTATFTYAVTDGYATSSPATVTLTVVDDSVETAPVWCGTASCVREWPSPQVSPGGYVSVDVLSGWVDPEGDSVMLIDAETEDPNASVSVVPTSDGKVAIRHLDANAGDEVIPIVVTVADSRGLTAQKTMELRVTSSPALVANPTAVTVAVDETATVELADMVTGGSGSYSLVDAVASTGLTDVLSVLPSAVDGTIDVSSSQAGSYSATYTVEDAVTGARQTAVLRVTVDSSARALAAAPVTAFVRAGEDTTVDVLAAVTSPGERVLMVQQVTTDDPGLSVSVVDQTYVRVSANSAAGDETPLGVADVIITDGTGAAVRTQLTVVLIPATHGVGPIAAPDTITVRAGSQIDIPVLDNDVAPRGERVLLHPDVTGSGTDGELVFASGTTLRYVAPTTPGVYTLHYSTYLESDPTKIDTAVVTVTVLPDGANSDPQPRDQEARVLAGQSVTLTIDTAGVDPDGDAVTLVGVAQPEAGQGVATIGPSGRTITYRAPSSGVSGGQVSFTYTVRDANGATGVATVRIGVLGGDLADVAPVTYNDNVSVELGSPAAVTVLPLTNDRDPLQGELMLVDIRPNVDQEKDPEEYERLESLIESVDYDTGVVSLRAGSQEGVHSYIYTVESSTSFSTAEGQIVVEVSDSPAPDSIQVEDTVVTLETRAILETEGLDVVTDQVTWATGDVDDLTLSLWDGAPAGYTVDGWTISGALPSTTTLVPFVLTGTDSSGNEAVGYGFLRIPALDDMRIQPATGVSSVEVGEDESVDVQVRDMLGLTSTDDIEIRDQDGFAVQRANASCTGAGGTSITYDAGREAPWTDTCSVAVRIDGQQTWSVVPIPFTIIPKDPQAVLGSVSRTVQPGATDSIDLIETMVSWEGDREGDVGSLDLQISYSGSSYVISRQGDELSVTAKADASPGTRETVTVTSSAYGGLSATVTLVVGAAKNDNPVGATFSTQCDVSDGNCTVTVVGVAGEYDPYAGAPESGLEVVAVDGGSSARCAVGTVSLLDSSTVQLTWPSNERPPGGECIVNFTVADAQGRTGQGTLTVDVLGYPQTPSSIVTQSYTADSVTMLVTLGPAAQAHPSVSGVKIYEDGKDAGATCTKSGAGAYVCTVSGLENGEHHTYTARAVNSVGESLDTSTVTTWAYDVPVIESMTAQTVYRANRTTTDDGVAALTITAADDVESFQIVNTGEVVTRTGTTTATEIVLPVGAQQVEVVPVSRFAPPITGTSEGSKSTVSVTVAGKPRFGSGSVTATATGTTLTVSNPTVDSNYSTETVTVVRAAWRTSTPTCTMSDDGQAVVSGAEATSSTATISGLTANEDYYVGVCASNGFGAVWLASSGTYLTWVAPGDPVGNSTYSVGTSPSWDGNVVSFMTVTEPNLNVGSRFTLYYRYDGANTSTDFTLSPAATQTITAASCLTRKPTNCGEWVPITPASSSPPTTVQVTFPTACYAEGTDASTLVTVTAAARGSATITVDTTTDEYVVTFSGSFSSLPELRYPTTPCAVPTPSVSPTP